MDPHANYAAVVSIKQKVLQDNLRAFYHNGIIPHKFNRTVQNIGFDFFMDPPEIILSGQHPLYIILGLTFRGRLGISLEGAELERKTITMFMQVLVRIDVALEGSSINIKPEPVYTELLSYGYEPYQNQSFSAAADAYIHSTEFRDRVAFALTVMLTLVNKISTPISVSFLGDISSADQKSVSYKIIDGAIALGIDASIESVGTSGDYSQLTEIPGGNDVSIWLNPVAIPIVLSSIYEKIKRKVAEHGATLTRLDIVINEGYFYMEGGATKTGGSVDFTMKLYPVRVAVGTPHESLTFEIGDTYVDTDLEWWARILEALFGVLTLSMGAFWIENWLSLIRNSIGNDITSDESLHQLTPVERVFTYAGLEEPEFRSRINVFECHSNGQFTGLSLSAIIPESVITGPHTLPVEEIGLVKYYADLPFDLHVDDISLLVEWRCEDSQTGDLIALTLDMIRHRQQSFSLTNYERYVADAVNVIIRCKIWRDNPELKIFLDDSVNLTARDPLDRRHPFVQWRHQVYKPVVRKETDGSKTTLGYVLRSKKSKIHLTKFPGRCLMASRFSITFFSQAWPFPNPKYMDTLPFPLSEINQHRRELCDYCFFGGPANLDYVEDRFD